MSLLKQSSEENNARFFSHVDTDQSTGCWTWTGGKTSQGYGRFYLNKRKVLAHRYSYAIHFGGIPAQSEVILHKCDNPSCVNPAHLVAGTILENVADRNQKSRQAKGSRIWKSKLSECQVLEIRKRYKRRVVTLKMLSIEYGVTLDQIHRVVTGKSWGHIEAAR